MTMRVTVAMTIVLAGLAGAGCGHTVLAIGSPFDRYDHNRTHSYEDAGSSRAIRVTDEMLAIQGSPALPRLRAGGAPSGDSLPSANLVPVFTGVALPLSAETVSGGRSDRDDVIDFLAAGPNAQVGVEPGDTMGDVTTTARCYADVLSLLSSSAQLGGGAPGIRAWARCCEVTFADEVVDPRYRVRAFAEITAFRYRQFWFVLYRLPARAAFSRLVVAPVKTTRQDFEAKTVGPSC